MIAVSALSWLILAAVLMGGSLLLLRSVLGLWRGVKGLLVAVSEFGETTAEALRTVEDAGEEMRAGLEALSLRTLRDRANDAYATLHAPSGEPADARIASRPARR